MVAAERVRDRADPRAVGAHGSLRKSWRRRAGIRVGLVLGFVCGDPTQLLPRALGQPPEVQATLPPSLAPPAPGVWLWATSTHTIGCLSADSRVTRAGLGLAAKTLNAKPSSPQAWPGPSLWPHRAGIPGSSCGVPISLQRQLRMRTPPPRAGICCLQPRLLCPQPLLPALTLQPPPQPGAGNSLPHTARSCPRWAPLGVSGAGLLGLQAR